MKNIGQVKDKYDEGELTLRVRPVPQLVQLPLRTAGRDVPHRTGLPGGPGIRRPQLVGAAGEQKPANRVRGVTGVILAGGRSSRMGSNKALLPRQGLRFIELIHRTLAELFDEVIVVTNTPEQYLFLPCRKVPDLYPGKGVLAGIHSGLAHSGNDGIFVVACDMPHLNVQLIRHLCTISDGANIVIPATGKGFEPLHALYRKGCLPALEELLRGESSSRVVALLSRVSVKELLPEEIAVFDPGFSSFTNINTPEEYFRLRKDGREPPSEPPPR